MHFNQTAPAKTTLAQGIPLQFTTDCGSETTQLYGLQNALR